MLLYRTSAGPVVDVDGELFAVDADWNPLLNDPQLHARLTRASKTSATNSALRDHIASPQAPIGDQEVWAAGVTYYRSRTARMEESETAGGGDFYDRVYAADRPELFFKATASRVVGPGQAMHLRRDSQWIVPEPELTLAITKSGNMIGYTIGNDLSSRDLEGENPLYLPQAKTFRRCAALGPAILVSPTPPPVETEIRLRIERAGNVVVEDSTTLAQLKRSLEELVGFLFRENDFAHGCFLMTGTGIIPPANFSLQAGDVVEISIDGIGTLTNPME